MAKEDRFVRPRAPNRSRIDFEGMIDKGKNPDAFNAQTVNGTAKWQGTGWNQSYDYEMPQLPPGPTRPPGRSNRSGE